METLIGSTTSVDSAFGESMLADGKPMLSELVGIETLEIRLPTLGTLLPTDGPALIGSASFPLDTVDVVAALLDDTLWVPPW